MALLEADVALPVVRDFIARVKEKALGQEVLGSLSPGQALVGIVNRELAATMGEGVADINLAGAAAGRDPDGRPAGRGQDHHHGQAGQAPDREAQEEGADRLGRRLPPGRHRAAQDGDQAGRRRMVPEHAGPEAGRHRPRRARLRQAALSSTCCWSTPPAGWRSTKSLMHEIKELHAALNPVETLFVVDAMQGQDAVNTAKAFKEALPLTGIILTKTGRRFARRRGAVGAAGHRRADQVRRRQREDRRAGGVRRRAPRRPHPGHGRHRRAGRAGHGRRRRRGGAEAGGQGQERRGLRPQRLPRRRSSR